MKTLLLFRHGKSDWHHPDADDDPARPLSRRGERAADKVGRWVRDAGLLPDLVSTSPARRASDTVRRAARAGEWPCPIEVDPSLYLAGAAGLIRQAAACDQRVERLLLVGHEPDLSTVIERLTGARCRFPTAAFAVIALPIDQWEAIRPGIGELHLLVVPRRLPDATRSPLR